MREECREKTVLGLLRAVHKMEIESKRLLKMELGPNCLGLSDVCTVYSKPHQGSWGKLSAQFDRFINDLLLDLLHLTVFARRRCILKLSIVENECFPFWNKTIYSIAKREIWRSCVCFVCGTNMSVVVKSM